MSCNCQKTIHTSPDGDCLPTIAEACALAKNTTVCKTCPSDDNSLSSDASDGTTLSSQWLDSLCASEDVVILGRVGNKLARFAGSGFIKLVNGKASVVTSVPLKLSTIWHNFWKPSQLSKPILGEPLAFPYQTIADEEGNLHVIKGVVEEDSIAVWDKDAQLFIQTPVSEIKKTQKGLLPRLPELEILGYAPIPADGLVTAVRDLSTLSGSGLIIVEQQDTVDATCACEGCEPVESKSSVAKFLPNPEADGTYTLQVVVTAGVAVHSWVEVV